MSTPEEWAERAANGAAEIRAWYDAYIRVGFTPDQAISLINRPLVQVTSQWPPEMMEAIERQSAFLTKMLSTMESD